jgi:glycosyltransferase involved in cell wall biosynthesis
MPPRVSVIVNCYNGERYLKEALDSIYAQSMSDFEVIFWDNKSTDGSAAIARSPAYASRMQYFLADENIPLGGARNLAVSKARGEFIAFLDTDDRWYAHTLAAMLAASRDDIDVVYAGIQNIDADGRALSRHAPPAREGDLLDALLRQFDVWLQCTLLRRSALERTGLSFDPATTTSEEYCLFMQLAAVCRFRSLPDVLADYRIHAGALTGKSVAKWADERFYTLDRLAANHPERLTVHAEAFAEARARGHYYRARHLMTIGERRAARAELRQASAAGMTYRLLYFLAMAPTPAWDLVHGWKTRRNIG